ncbi:MAG: DNA gyrase subunit A, partial [Cyanobacteria bacterium P01_A01_bin.105]
GLIALIERPELSDEKLFQLIPGPDFPTGGEVINKKGIYDAYRKGRGSIPVRGIASFEEIRPGRGRQRRNAIVVTELPYQVNKAGWIEKVADLVNQGRIDGIADIRDESDRDGMRVVIELRREAQPPKILSDLYRMTPLQSNFGAIMLALDGGQPKQLSLREMLNAFLNFREETLTRQYRHELEETEARLHIVEGLLTALDSIDEVIEILRAAPDGGSARQELQGQFDLSERQANAILAMPLRRLVGLEQQKLLEEFEELSERQASLQELLDDRKVLLKALKKELRTLKKAYGDDRRTRLRTEAEQAEEKQVLAELEAEAKEEETVVEFTQKGYARRLSPRAYQRRQAKADPPPKGKPKLQEADDPVLQTEQAHTHQELLVFTHDGKAYTLKLADIPIAQRQSKGSPLVNLLPDAVGNDPDTVVTRFVLTPQALAQHVILVSRQGRIKRLTMTEFQNLTGRGLTAMKLKGDDRLAIAALAPPNRDVVLATTGGRLLRFAIDDDQLPLASRSTQGTQGIRVLKQEGIVGAAVVTPSEDLLLVSARGYAKRMPVSTLKRANRGGIGSQCFQFSHNSDQLLVVLPTAEHNGVTVTGVVVLSSQDRSAQFGLGAVPKQGRSQPCDRILTPARGETLTLVEPLGD